MFFLFPRLSPIIWTCRNRFLFFTEMRFLPQKIIEIMFGLSVRPSITQDNYSRFFGLTLFWTSVILWKGFPACLESKKKQKTDFGQMFARACAVQRSRSLGEIIDAFFWPRERMSLSRNHNNIYCNNFVVSGLLLPNISRLTTARISHACLLHFFVMYYLSKWLHWFCCCCLLFGCWNWGAFCFACSPYWGFVLFCCWMCKKVDYVCMLY